MEVALNSTKKKRRLTFCLRAGHGVPLSELSTLSRHSVFVQWRARSTPFQILPRTSLPSSPLPSSPTLPPQTAHRWSDPFGVRFNPPNASAATLLHDQACVQTSNSPRPHLPSFPRGKVKSYGSVKAILSVLAFHVIPAGVFLRLFPTAHAKA